MYRLPLYSWKVKSAYISNEKSVDSVKSLAYNDIKTESLSVDEFKGMKPENAGI
jgi:hypothetical protein